MGYNSYAQIIYGSVIDDDDEEITFGKTKLPEEFWDDIEELDLDYHFAGDWDPGILILGQDFSPNGGSYVSPFDPQNLINFQVEEKQKIDDAITFLQEKYPDLVIEKPQWLLTSRYS